jgi:hypothetical protein
LKAKILSNDPNITFPFGHGELLQSNGKTTLRHGCLGGCLSEPDLMGGIVAWQKHNLSTLLQLTVFGLLVSVLKEFLFHNQPHYSKF